MKTLKIFWKDLYLLNRYANRMYLSVLLSKDEKELLITGRGNGHNPMQFMEPIFAEVQMLTSLEKVIINVDYVETAWQKQLFDLLTVLVRLSPSCQVVWYHHPQDDDMREMAEEICSTIGISSSIVSAAQTPFRFIPFFRSQYHLLRGDESSTPIDACSLYPTVMWNMGAGIFTLSGRARVENTNSFVKPLCQQIQFLVQGKQLNTFVFSCLYVDGAFEKALIDIFRELVPLGNRCLIEWHFETDDDDMREMGEQFAELYPQLSFSFVEEQKFTSLRA